MANITQEQILNSALWAAYGDAVGFPTELISQDDFLRRNKLRKISGPIDWNRKVGGLFGPEISFPVGSYSDDTQLRLSTSRAIRGDGFFDVESFAKIELPVWLNYALGAGRGSKAAAANLALREATWSQNFYNANGLVYWNGGGNGAAMRIQPHVWQGHLSGPSQFMREVVRNSICTHGHPRAIIGAAIHALFLFETLSRKNIISPSEWAALGEYAAVLAYEALVEDVELALVWIPNWENFSKSSLQAVWADTVLEWHHSVEVAQRYCVDVNVPSEAYGNLLNELNGFKPEERGSGLKTVLFASALAWLFKNDDPKNALLLSANSFKSDTDTIATMAGAILGAIAKNRPDCEIQDAAYIQEEAQRIYNIGAGKRQPSFKYPDLLSWTPPKNQSDSWVIDNGKSNLKGLGELYLLGESFSSTKGTQLVWQWCVLPFGQTVLAKRRKNSSIVEDVVQKISLNSKNNDLKYLKESKKLETSEETKLIISKYSIDEYTHLCIKSGFNAKIIGESLLEIAEGDAGIEKAIAFAAIIAKAKIAREKNKG